MRWVVVVAVMLWAVEASANMRAPRVVEQESSSALFPAEGLVVLGEELGFECGLDQCDVRAVYRVKAEAEQELEFEFLMPDGVGVTARVGEGSSEAKVSEYEAKEAEKALVRDEYSWREDGKLHKAVFRGVVKVGENVIEVRYKQPLAAMERDYGYFKDGRFVHAMRYEVWPLKQWTLDAGFELTVKARFVRQEEAGWWARSFGEVPTMACEGVRLDQTKSYPEPVASKWGVSDEDLKGKEVLKQAGYKAGNLPDRVVCRFGDNDLVP
jgi:hypothetical protein